MDDRTGLAQALPDDGRSVTCLTRPGPVVIGANWYRFRAGERIVYDHVASVSFIWVIQGSGTIVAGGREYSMVSQSILGLPWMHGVDYRPDDRTPFQLGTIHVVPLHEAGVPVEQHVPFLGSDPLLRSPHRRGLGGLPHPVLTSHRSASGRRVMTLASYCVDKWADGFDARVFGPLGELILHESRTWLGEADEPAGIPMTLTLMTDHVLGNLAEPLSVAEIAGAGNCSTATAERLFARHLGLSTQSWVRTQRMRAAAELLRTTGLRVNEVARQVGFTDPLYFSRVFRSTFGMPPSQYARDRIRP